MSTKRETARKIATDAPIGLFDSGLGGLTVARAIRDALPAERLLYLGDTARVPYGTRSAETIIRYARSCARVLGDRGVKLLVVACNTVSAVALDVLRVELDIPVVGVIAPGAAAAVAATKNGRIGVIATNGTVRSGAYVRAVAALASRAEVIARPAPLLVPLVEEGWIEGEVPRLAAIRYVEPLHAAGIDTLVLGCTHYPLLTATLREVVDALEPHRPITIVDGGVATANAVSALLRERHLVEKNTSKGSLAILVTDLPDKFREAAARFLGGPVTDLAVEAIDL